jgi:hypothetical protein
MRNFHTRRTAASRVGCVVLAVVALGGCVDAPPISEATLDEVADPVNPIRLPFEGESETRGVRRLQTADGPIEVAVRTVHGREFTGGDILLPPQNRTGIISDDYDWATTWQGTTS